jgi:hypothetical protein
MFTGDWLQQRELLSPNKVALIDALNGNRPTSCRQWDWGANRLANVLDKPIKLQYRGAFLHDRDEAGRYVQAHCQIQMKKDAANAMNITNSKYDMAPRDVVRYCRACEFSCPVAC